MKKKYEVLGVVGEGAYGIVYKCKNKETGKYVAIKKFKETEDELVQKTMKRELKMLQQLKHENIVEFQESFTYKGNLFLVFEYCEKNLLEVLEESPEGLSPKLIKSFIYQMCKAIAYMHKNNMIHRDIKPENLLIDDKLNLKLCDFGFARKVKLNKNNNNINEMTDYVATRWYRSPELLLSGGIYGPDVDYWAVGCIMGELADGNPMFPGENETDQINCIIKVLGNLPEDLVNMFYKNPIYEGKELLHVSKPESLERRYMGKLGPTAIDFLKGLLQLDPKKRLNTETVFKHKYFACFMKDEQKEKINTNNNTINTINNDKIANKDNNNNVNKISESKESIKVNVGSKNEKINSIIKGNTIENKSTNNLLENNNKINNPQPKQTTETKVINNTTNINIINYNTINNPTNNFIEIHHNNIGDNLNSINNNNNSISNNKNIKDNKIPQNNNILVNNSMIIKVTNTKDMFNNCTNLISIEDIDLIYTKDITNMSGMFYRCSSLTSLPDISKWNTENVTNMRNMFSGCSSLLSLPDISKWNMSNVNDIYGMFNECLSLTSLPDISNWDIHNVTNMRYLCNECKSLKSIPDTTKWNFNNVVDKAGMFGGCNKLAFKPSFTGKKKKK